MSTSADNLLVGNDLAPEAKVDDEALGFWKNPNLNYIATEWPVDDNDLKFWAVPKLEKALIDTAPTDRNDGLIVGTLGTNGGDKDMIVKLAQEVADGQLDEIDSLLIAHKGKLVFESYYSWGRANLTHPQASATKTYTGLALGRAIQLGYLTMADLDKPVVSFLKELDPTKFVEGAEKITLHHALTRRTGIRISEEQRKEFEKKPDQLKGQRMVQTILEQSQSITSENLNSFSYGAYSVDLVMQVIDAVVPGTAEEFIKTELLGKMGITTYRWLSGPSGLPAAGWKSSITSRSMVKLGTLAMNKGKWNGEQLIPEAFISKATNRIITTGDYKVYGGGKDISNQGYGYLWWTADMEVGDKSFLSASAQGGGGQFIILIEELDLMVVATGHERHPSTLQLTAEKILPAFIKNSTLTLSEKSDSQDKFPLLEGPYLGQQPPGLTPEVFAPGIVSTELRDWTGNFTPDMKEYYFTRLDSKNRKSTTVFFKFENNRWNKRVLDSRMGGSISPDGKTMYSGKQYRERINDGWSELRTLGSPFEDFSIMTLKVSSKGTYVFDEMSRNGNGLLRYSRLVNGKREAPRPFSKAINTGTWTAHPFIAPDESYIIWDSENEGGYGGVDLYISFRQKDGSWGEAINFGDKVNTDGPDSGGFVSPDGKYLFFNRKISPVDSDTYWVDAKVIETLRPKQ
jgi:CubicO group peptidase (beta-lactamase class C family)